MKIPVNNLTPENSGVHDVPVRFVEEAIQEVWTKKPVEEIKTIETPALKPNTWAIVLVSIVAIIFLAGFLAKDTTVQDQLDIISKQNGIIRQQEAVKTKADTAITAANAKKNAAKEKLAKHKIIISE